MGETGETEEKYAINLDLCHFPSLGFHWPFEKKRWNWNDLGGEYEESVGAR